MADSNRLETVLPTQQRSSAKDRLIIDRDGVRQQIMILTCQTTAAHYCLYLTGRIGLEGMADSIDQSIDHMLSYRGRSYKTGDVQVISSGDLGRWLVLDNKVPFFSLLKENGRKPVDWRDQLAVWLKEGGTALVAYGYHARTLVEDEREGNIVQIDPATASKAPIKLATLPEETFDHCMLIPPRPENATVGMINILRERVELLNPLVGNREMVDHIVEQSSWGTPASLQLVERMYLPRKGVVRIKPYQVKERGLPKVVTVDLDRDGREDVVIESPGRPPRTVRLPSQVVVVSPKRHEIIKIRSGDLTQQSKPIVVKVPSVPTVPTSIRVEIDKK